MTLDEYGYEIKKKASVPTSNPVNNQSMISPTDRAQTALQQTGPKANPIMWTSPEMILVLQKLDRIIELMEKKR